MPKIKILFSLVAILAFTSCDRNTEPTPVTVTVSMVPQKFFVEQIAGDWLNVNVMIPAGASHATYEPTPQQMISLSKSQIYFRIGNSGFEDAWMDKIESINKTIKVVDTSKDIELLVEEKGCDHSLSHSHHSHQVSNPHIWLSPQHVKIQAKHISNTLADIYPEHKDSILINYNNFINKVDSAHIALKKYFENIENRNFIVYHPVWSYMAKDYNLNQVAIEHNGKEATAKYLAEIIAYANTNNVKIIFVQKEFSSDQAETIAKEIGGKVITMNPLAYDWFNTMKEFKEAFK